MEIPSVGFRDPKKNLHCEFHGFGQHLGKPMKFEILLHQKPSGHENITKVSFEDDSLVIKYGILLGAMKMP